MKPLVTVPSLFRTIGRVHSPQVVPCPPRKRLMFGGPKWLQLCNTSFFGIRRDVLEDIGGGFGPQYPHYWADDFLCYAVLDQGLDVRHFDRRFRERRYFHEFQYDNTDVADRRRHEDRVSCDRAFLDSVRLIHGGMSEEESVFLHLLAQSVPDGSTVTNVGVWKGSSATVLLDGLKHKRVNFHFIDCFDVPGVSAMSAQPPATREEFLRNITPYIGPRHNVNIVRTNTLEMDAFPKSDFVFVDGGHTKECITYDARLTAECLTPAGAAVFHDYGCPSWPDVRPVLDEEFGELQAHGTTAVFRKFEPPCESYDWPEAACGGSRLRAA